MATLPQFVDTLAELDPLRDKSQIHQFGRAMREAGLIPGGKRGLGAPDLSAQHVTSLLLGTFGGYSQAQSPNVVSQLRRLTLFEGELEYKVGDDDAFKAKIEGSALANILKKADNFGEAIENLIICAPIIARELPTFCGSKDTGDEDPFEFFSRNSAAFLHITLHPTHAIISVVDLHNRVPLVADFQTPADRWGELEHYLKGDRSPSVTFTQNSLFALHKTLVRDA